MDRILQRYDGPVLVERLAHVAFRGEDEASYRAAFEALRHLDAVSQYSPLVEQLINKANRLEGVPDEVLARVLQYSDPGWVLHLQERKADLLKQLNADNLYHEKDTSTHIKVATIYTYNRLYSEANGALSSYASSSATCTLSELSAQIGILQGNNLHISSQEKRIDSFLSTCQTSELYHKRLTKAEVTSYWRTKLLIIFIHFLRQNFSEVIADTEDLLNSEPIKTFDGEPIGPLDVLNASDFNKFIHSDEIRFAVALSTLLHTPATELNDAVSNADFVAFMGPMIMDIRPFATALINANFKKVFTLLDEMSEEAESNVLINKVWSDVKLKFRRKGYLLYLSLVKRVPLQHLAQKLNVEPTRLLRELKELIKDEKLEYGFTQNDTILEAVTIDKKDQYHERLQKLAETTDTLENELTQKLESMGTMTQSQTSSSSPTQFFGTSGAKTSMKFAVSSFFAGSSRPAPKIKERHTPPSHDDTK